MFEHASEGDRGGDERPAAQGDVNREFASLLSGLVDHLARQGAIPSLARRVPRSPEQAAR